MDAKSKTCRGCGEEKLLDEFSADKHGKYNRKSRCKLCVIKHYQANKEENNKRSRNYYKNNKEKILEQKKQYHQTNKEKILEYKKQYHQANKEQKKQYHQTNKEKINKRERFRRKNDEQHRTRKRLSSLLRKSLNTAKTTKKNSTLNYIGCSIEFMKEHLNSTKKPDWGDDLHIDHIIPKTSFDHTNDEEVKKCWNWRNLRYLPAEENMSKYNTLDMDLVKSYGIEDLLPEGVDK
jgi:hypothetical protein